jgi:hypothetical protein
MQATVPKELDGSDRFGWWASLGTGVTTLLTLGIAIATPPLSGPLCAQGCFGYPYLDVASRFPRDYLWMFPAIVATLFYVAFMLSLEARARPERRLVARLGVTLGVMAALTLLGDYVIQLAVIQPSLLAGEADGVSLLSQYNPHGVFIALEELGYGLMSAALGCIAPALPGGARLERAVRRLFVGGFATCVLALAWFLARYGHGRAYRFELAVISVVWLTLIPGAFMMAAVCGRATSRQPSSQPSRRPSSRP